MIASTPVRLLRWRSSPWWSSSAYAASSGASPSAATCSTPAGGTLLPRPPANARRASWLTSSTETQFQVTTDDGRDVRVRFLGISAPEIPHPGRPGECYGHLSARHLKQLLPAGTHVTLVSDPTQDNVDPYGRWLRYVKAAGRDMEPPRFAPDPRPLATARRRSHGTDLHPARGPGPRTDGRDVVGMPMTTTPELIRAKGFTTGIGGLYRIGRLYRWWAASVRRWRLSDEHLSRDVQSRGTVRGSAPTGSSRCAHGPAPAGMGHRSPTRLRIGRQ